MTAQGIIADTHDDQHILVILDNYSTHQKNHDWLAKHPQRSIPIHAHVSQSAYSSRNATVQPSDLNVNNMLRKTDGSE